MNLIVIILVVTILAFALRKWFRGPTKGSDNIKQLDGKTVVITGKYRTPLVSTPAHY